MEKNTSDLKKLLNKINSNPGLIEEFKKDPEAILKKHNIDPDDLPSDVIEKISGADFGLITIPLLLGGLCYSAFTSDPGSQDR